MWLIYEENMTILLISDIFCKNKLCPPILYTKISFTKEKNMFRPTHPSLFGMLQ